MAPLGTPTSATGDERIFRFRDTDVNETPLCGNFGDVTAGPSIRLCLHNRAQDRPIVQRRPDKVMPTAPSNQRYYIRREVLTYGSARNQRDSSRASDLQFTLDPATG